MNEDRQAIQIPHDEAAVLIIRAYEVVTSDPQKCSERSRSSGGSYYPNTRYSQFPSKTLAANP